MSAHNWFDFLAKYQETPNIMYKTGHTSEKTIEGGRNETVDPDWLPTLQNIAVPYPSKEGSAIGIYSVIFYFIGNKKLIN